MKARLLIYTLIAMVAVLISLSVQVVVADGLANHALKADYIVFLLGGTMFDQGHRAAVELYNIAIQSSVQQHILAASPVRFVDGLLPFVHPPYVALIASPLSYLAPAPGFVLWDVCQLLLLLLSLWLLRPMLPPEHQYLLWLGAFGFFPVYQSLLEGQISPMLLLSIVLLWHCLRLGGKADWWAGVSLALGLVKPHLIILFVLYLLYKRNWRALGGFAASGFLLYLLTASFAGLDWPFIYLNTLGWLNAQVNHYGMLPQVMFNWHGLLVRFNLDNGMLLSLLIGATAVALIYAWWRSEQAGKGGIYPAPAGNNNVGAQSIAPQWQGGINPAPTAPGVGTLELQLAATTLAAVITSLYLYTHDLTMLLFSGAALLGWAAQAKWPTWLSAVLLANLFAPLLILYGQPLDALFGFTMLIAFAALLHLLAPPATAPPLPSTALPQLGAAT